MPRTLTIILVAIAAAALPAVMAGATLYASNAAIMSPGGELVPHFGNGRSTPLAPASRPHRHHAPSTTRRASRTSGQRSGSHVSRGGSTTHRSGGSHRWGSGSSGWSSGGGSRSSHNGSGGGSGGGWDS